jgi:pimeloyl-ACP methyl ester carboxylesterase
MNSSSNTLLTDLYQLSGKSSIAPSPYGDIEYTQGGAGPAVLVIHGAGGGHDQGELIAVAVLNEQFHWIAPSRFGYLRSELRAGATSDDQAHAYACLLDHLRVQRVAVVAVSAGGPSALLFALLHPEQVSSLTLKSCGVVPTSSEDLSLLPQMRRIEFDQFRRLGGTGREVPLPRREQPRPAKGFARFQSLNRYHAAPRDERFQSDHPALDEIEVLSVAVLVKDFLTRLVAPERCAFVEEMIEMRIKPRQERVLHYRTFQCVHGFHKNPFVSGIVSEIVELSKITISPP